MLLAGDTPNAFAGIRTLRPTAGLCKTCRFNRLGPIHPGRPPLPPRKPVQMGGATAGLPPTV